MSVGPRSKQFLQLLPASDGGVESMVQRVVRQLREAGLGENMTFATGEAQKELLISQLGADISIVTEPERRNTFPAIALAAAHLYYECGCGVDEPVVVMPCDPFTEAGYFETLRKMAAAVEGGAADLVLMGIRPDSPSVKYGYIVPDGGFAFAASSPACGSASSAPAAGSVSAGGSTPSAPAAGSASSAPAAGSASSGSSCARRVSRFVEKPSAAEATELISNGALWNGGVFAFRLGYILQVLGRYVQVSLFSELRARYAELPADSFDYEVAEKAESVAVVPFDGMWKDLGTWDALTAEISGDHVGHAVLGGGAENTSVINGLDVPVIALGAKNLVIVASPDGILVCDKDECANLRPYVEALNK